MHTQESSRPSFQELIAKKRDRQELTDDEIDVFVEAVVNGTAADCQIGAMLMAVYLNSLSLGETSALTKCMRNSGSSLTWPSDWSGFLVDKHSTGGVGDKISLVLAPALAALDMKVPMISGRGLAHTGGTLDKLETIPGFKVSLTLEEMTVLLSTVGCFIAGQTENICPADKRLYGIRDVTGTVKQMGLITASILSKKSAENLNALVLDVKTGKGAFLQDQREALELAQCMVSCGQSLGIKTIALVTDMNSPIGNMVGNALEVAEALQCLQNLGPDDLSDLVAMLGGHLLFTSGHVISVEEGNKQIRKTIENGSALSKFCAMLKGQGVDNQLAEELCDPSIDIWTKLTPAKSKTAFWCPHSGYVQSIDSLAIAVVAHKLGAGRNAPGEAINGTVGVQLRVDIGDRVEKGQAWATVHHDIAIPEEVKTLLSQALAIYPDPVPPRPCRLQRVVM